MQSLQICNISQEPINERYFYFRVFGHKDDLLLYQDAYNTDSKKELSDDRKKEIKKQAQSLEVLDALFRLGFPEEEEGTYLYKDMIVKAIQYMNGFDVRGISISEEELLRQMQDKYSQFYLDVARNDLDMGIKTFHTYINHALSSVDYACVDSDTLSEIYGDFAEEADYGKHAFVIAKNFYEHNKAKQASQGQSEAVQYVKEMPVAAGQLDN